MTLDRPVRRSRQRGSAYLIALGGCLGLAVVAVMVLAFATRLVDRAVGVQDLTRAEAVADGLLHRAVFALLDEGERGRLPRDGTPLEADFLGHRTRLSIQDVRGLVDLNAVEPDLLRALFERVGLSPRQMEQAVEALLEMRRPRSGDIAQPLVHATALDRLPGLEGPTKDRLLPLVTVHSGAATIDPWSAPGPVLEAATGAPAEEVAAFLLARRAGAGIAPPESFARGPFAISDGRVFALLAEVLGEDGRTLVRRRAVVRLAPVGPTPYRFLEYR